MGCYAGFMSRTNIEIDDELIARVMERWGFRTKREAVDQALQNLDVKPFSREEILALRGIGWEGDLDEMRSIPPPVKDWIERD
jgi:Arc/MetJ family transcription regulator